MIKTALKHWIYEICIDQLFNGIINNFIIKSKKFNIGDKFLYIDSVHKDADEFRVTKYSNVTIMNIHPNNTICEINWDYKQRFSDKNENTGIYITYYDKTVYRNIEVESFEEYCKKYKINPPRTVIFLNSLGRYKRK